MKKFFTLLIAALLMFTAPANAQNSHSIENADSVADVAGDSAEKFYASLPQAKGDYKSKRRPILIEGAMNIEIETLVRALKNPVAYRELNWLFVAGTYENYPVVIVRTEQGVANAAVSTALAIKKFNPVAVINQGTAGGHDPALKLGDIIIGASTFDYTAVKTAYTPAGAGSDITQQEMRGTYAYDATAKKFQPYTEYRADTTLFNMAFAAANNFSGAKIVSGVIGTGNAWLQNLDYIAFLHERYGSSCEEMETCAAAQVCHTAGVPFIGIRVLSDNVIIGQEYTPHVAKPCQEFVLLVAQHYIRNILLK